VKAKISVTLDDGRTYMLASLLRKGKMRSDLINRRGRFANMSGTLGMPLRFACRKLRTGELLIIVTNSEDPLQALRAYKRRWFIECMFGDSKTRGLNLEDTAMRDPAKLSLLIAIVTLAMVWSYACARAIKGRHPIARASHGYLRKSWFRTGFDQLRNWIFHDPGKAAAIWNKLWPKRSASIKFKRVV
jgi:hypothetical protein